jgi:hypothetical protein
LLNSWATVSKALRKSTKHANNFSFWWRYLSIRVLMTNIWSEVRESLVNPIWNGLINLCLIKKISSLLLSIELSNLLKQPVIAIPL